MLRIRQERTGPERMWELRENAKRTKGKGKTKRGRGRKSRDVKGGKPESGRGTTDGETSFLCN